MSVETNAVLTTEAPAPIGPYSQAIHVELKNAQSILYCSGQIPLNPATGEIVGAGDVEAQTKQVMKNIAAVLSKAGTDFSKVVKTTIFLKNTILLDHCTLFDELQCRLSLVLRAHYETNLSFGMF